MIKKIAFLILGLFAVPTTGWAAASCSRVNLTKCLDSACAINLSANPAARCQYCGTSDAGLPKTNGMKNVSTAASSKYTISSKELKSAPTDAGERYVWATELCLKKIQNCTPDDVTDIYDELIEKSCNAVVVNNSATTSQKKLATNTKTTATCTNEISVCITASDKCDSNFAKCADDSAFDNFFAICSNRATGCTNFLSTARSEITTTRKTVLAGTESNIESIVNAHKTARKQKITSVTSNCTSDKIFNDCVESACKKNTTDNCASDKTVAIALCEYYKTACTKIK